MDILKKGRTVIGQQMNNNMIQSSVFAGIVFIIIAHPQTFKLVDSVIKVHNKNILLLVHAVVVSLIMYFGSLYLFIPAQKVLLEGVQNKSTWGDMKKTTGEVAKKLEEKGLPTGIRSEDSDRGVRLDDANDDKGMDPERDEIDRKHNSIMTMTIKDTVACLNEKGIKGGNLDNTTLREIGNLCG